VYLVRQVEARASMVIIGEHCLVRAVARPLPHRDEGPARRVLRDRAREVLRDTVPRVCAGFGAVMKEMNGEDDPAHLLGGPPPTVQLSRLVSSPKGVSSLLRQHDFSEVRRRWSASSLSGLTP
jgi:putative transposase